MRYLEDFQFLSDDREFFALRSEHRTCFNSVYPFGVIAPRGLESAEFDNVTIFYGGNGSGKSTVLNIIAAKLGLLRELPFKPSAFWEKMIDLVDYNTSMPEYRKGIPAGSRILTSEDVFDKTLSLRSRNHDINFRRSVAEQEWVEQTYGETKRLSTIHGRDYEEWSRQHSIRKQSMSQFIRSEVGFNVKTGSNGENAFEFFMEKMQPRALYLLDEPENSLSAKWQVKLAELIAGMARFEECQFVIATHSPFMLGVPQAKIYDLDTNGVPVRRWTELENVRHYYDFFKSREREFEE